MFPSSNAFANSAANRLNVPSSNPPATPTVHSIDAGDHFAFALGRRRRPPGLCNDRKGAYRLLVFGALSEGWRHG